MNTNKTEKLILIGGIIVIGLVLLGQILLVIGNGGLPLFGGESPSSNTGLGLEILPDTDFRVEQNLYVNLTQVELSHCSPLLAAVNDLISSGSSSFSVEVVPEESECLYTFQETYMRRYGVFFYLGYYIHVSLSIA